MKVKTYRESFQPNIIWNNLDNNVVYIEKTSIKGNVSLNSLFTLTVTSSNRSREDCINFAQTLKETLENLFINEHFSALQNQYRHFVVTLNSTEMYYNDLDNIWVDDIEKSTIFIYVKDAFDCAYNILYRLYKREADMPELNASIHLTCLVYEED